MMRFRCLTIPNGCHRALSSLASLQLPETIDALQEKDTPLLMCHLSYEKVVRQTVEIWEGFGWVFRFYPPVGVR